MAQFVYNRDAVPVGSSIKLEVQYKDSAGNNKDADSTPTVRVLDADSTVVRAASSTGVGRLGLGYYRLEFAIEDGFEEGEWSDIWTASIDGYELVNTFTFIVNSIGSAEAVGTVVEEEYEVGDDPNFGDYTQDEIKNINYLLKILKARLRNTAFKPDGSPCDVFDEDDLVSFLHVSLSEFNMTPTLTSYGFSDANVVALFSDILTQGAMLIAWSGQAIMESGREFTITDNGVVVQPPPVSSTINTQFSGQLADYRSKLREIKRNLRPGPRGMGAGSLLVTNPLTRRLRHRKENILI